MILTRSRKLALTVALFAVAVALVLLAGDLHGVGPLFGAWIPLLMVPYLLTRPEPGDPPAAQDAPEAEPDRPSPEEG